MFDRLLKIKSHQASETLQDSSPLITYRLISVGSTDTAASPQKNQQGQEQSPFDAV